MTISRADTRRPDSSLAQLCVLGLCPLLTTSSAVTDALAVCVVALSVALLTALFIPVLSRWLPTELRMPVLTLVLAGLVSAAAMAIQALRPALDFSPGVALPLVASIALVLSLRDREAAPAMRDAGLRHAVLSAFWLALTLLMLAALRELVGQGSIAAGLARLLGEGTHRSGIELFDARRGFLLALLPPGGLMLLGLMLAVRKAWRTRRTPPAARAAA